LADLPTIVDATEAATAGGPGAAEVAAVRDHWRRNDLI
jgi:hypothetical protein